MSNFDPAFFIGQLIGWLFIITLAFMILRMSLARVKAIPVFAASVMATAIPAAAVLYFASKDAAYTASALIPMLGLWSHYRYANLPRSGFRRIGAIVAMVAVAIGLINTIDANGNSLYAWAASAFVAVLWSGAMVLRWVIDGFKSGQDKSM